MALLFSGMQSAQARRGTGGGVNGTFQPPRCNSLYAVRRRCLRGLLGAGPVLKRAAHGESLWPVGLRFDTEFRALSLLARRRGFVVCWDGAAVGHLLNIMLFEIRFVRTAFTASKPLSWTCCPPNVPTPGPYVTRDDSCYCRAENKSLQHHNGRLTGA
jgi:hypothetical protein